MTTYYSFSVAANGADVSVTVNGILVETFTDGQSGGGPMNSWMTNGPNEVVFAMTPVGDSPNVSASIEVSGPEGYEELASFAWPGQEGPAAATVEASGIPEWAWRRAEAVPEAGAEVTASVMALHDALDKSDEAAFRKLAAGLYADWEVIAGKEQLAESHKEMWKNFRKKLQPVGKLTIVSYRDGQVYSALDAEGMAPIQSVDDDGGVFSMGQWWGKVDGTWQMIK